MRRAELGVDGNCGFALLGEDIQSGEAEFIAIQTTAPVGSSEWCRAASTAATTAYHRLKERLAPKQFSYYIGPSHPNHV